MIYTHFCILNSFTSSCARIASSGEFHFVLNI